MNAIGVVLLAVCLIAGSVAYAEPADEPKEPPVLKEWRGEYPVSAICGLHEG